MLPVAKYVRLEPLDQGWRTCEGTPGTFGFGATHWPQGSCAGWEVSLQNLVEGEGRTVEVEDGCHSQLGQGLQEDRDLSAGWTIWCRVRSPWCRGQARTVGCDLQVVVEENNQGCACLWVDMVSVLEGDGRCEVFCYQRREVVWSWR